MENNGANFAVSLRAQRDAAILGDGNVKIGEGPMFMRTSTRRLFVAVLACVAALFALSVPSAHAATAVTGRLLLQGTDPVRDVTVQLYTNVDGVPGTLFGSDDTNHAGLFVIDTSTAAPTDTFFVRILADDEVQGGWLGAGAVQSDLAFAEAVAPAALGDQWATASWITSRVVDASGHGVGGVTVTLRDVLAPDVVVHTATIKPNGRFEFTGVDFEEWAAYVDGSAEGYESGFVACDGNVVATWGEACSVGAGAWSVDVVLDELP